MLTVSQIPNVDIFKLPQDGEGVCVTTNGMIKSNGAAVMGAGIALQADRQFRVSTTLGEFLRQYGNHVFQLGMHLSPSGTWFHLLTFPTKHDWRQNSDLSLIAQSCHELIHYCSYLGLSRCYLPPVGCGCGKLDFHKDVLPLLERILGPSPIEFHIVLR